MSARKAALAVRVAEVFYPHRRRYGSRRIAAHLQAEGHKAGRRVARTVMRRQGLQAIRPRRFVPRTTDSRQTDAPALHLPLGARNGPGSPRGVIVGDITYLPLRAGRRGYLASWQGKFTERVVGWAVESRLTDDLVIKAFRKAAVAGGVRAGTIVHTDRGSQYVSNDFRALLTSYGCCQSMSRRANCYDHAQAESFFSRYEAGLPEGGASADIDQARGKTFSYAEGYYNRARRHPALGYKIPAEFEREWELKTKGEGSERVASGKT